MSDLTLVTHICFHVLASFMSKPKFSILCTSWRGNLFNYSLIKKFDNKKKMVWLYYLLAHTLAPLVPARLFWKTGTAYGAKNMEIVPQGISNPKLETASFQLQVQRSTNWATGYLMQGIGNSSKNIVLSLPSLRH